jgi:LPS-assembly protein
MGVTKAKRPQTGEHAGMGVWARLTLALGVSAVALSLTASEGKAFIKKKPFTKPVTTKPDQGTVADFTADQLSYDPKSKLAIATGKVVITYGPYTLNATRVTYNRETDAFSANGSVELREPNGNILLAAKINLTNKFKAGFAQHLTALLNNDVTITARYAKRIDGHITIFTDSHYTACRDCKTRNGDPLWELVADQSTHDQDTHDITEINPRLKIAGITVGGLPYLVHPDPTVKRRTGWLPPKFKSSSPYGIGVVTPYFWAFAPDKDLTFRPMFTTRQGPVADVEYRQATATGRFNVEGFGVYQFTPNHTSHPVRWRGAIKSKGDFAANDVWSWGWQGTLQNDRSFLDDYEFDKSRVAENRLYVTGLEDRNYVSAQLLNYTGQRNTDVDNNSLPYALPYVKGEHYFAPPVFGGELSMDWSAYSLNRDGASTPYSGVNHATTQSRATTNVRWKTRYIADNGVLITPFTSVKSDLYVNNNLPDPTAASGFATTQTTVRVLPTAGLDMRWPMVASYDDGQSIVSPVFQFIASGNEKNVNKVGNEDAITLNFDHTNLFLAERHSGDDREEGGVRTNIGATYSFLGINGGFIRASAGESIHIAGKNSYADGSGLSQSKSDLVGAVTFQPWDYLTFSHEIRLKEDFSAITRQESLLSLTLDRFSFDASYLDLAAAPAYGRLTTEQWANADVRVGLSEGWYLFGGLRYDFEKKGVTDKKLGLEFDCDCMNFKVTYSDGTNLETNVTEKRLMMSIDLATLGGTQVSSKLK